jgi:alpha-D-ribose 1-methylphosphonate 5-triphosphate synthase subunit PhnG
MRYGSVLQNVRRMMRSDIRAIVAHAVAELQDLADELSHLDERYAIEVARALEVTARQIRAKHGSVRRRRKYARYGEGE